MKHRIALFICAWGICARCLGAEDSAKVTTYTFDHFSERPSSTKTVHLRPQEKFNVVISNTCPDSLVYTVDQSPRSQSPAKPKDLILVNSFDGGVTPPNPVTSVTKGPITFDPKYGSYAVTVWLKPDPDGQKRCDIFVNSSGTPVSPPDEAKKDRNYSTERGHWITADLTPRQESPDRFTVAIEADEWDVGADAALAMTFAQEPHYTTADVQTTVTNAQGQTSTQTVKHIVEDLPGESQGRITFGTLMHFYFPGDAGGYRHGPVLGFSVVSSSNNQTEYYFGYGAGLGPVSQRLNVAAGIAYAPVATLPAGLAIGSQVTDASAIANLRSVYRWRFFFGVTATVFRSAGTPASQKPAAPAGQ